MHKETRAENHTKIHRTVICVRTHRQRHTRRLREAVVFIVQLRKVVLGKLKSAGVPPHPREETLQKPS